MGVILIKQTHREILTILQGGGFSSLEVCKPKKNNKHYPEVYAFYVHFIQLSAAFALLQFVMFTQRSEVPHLSPPSEFSHHQHMAIDPNTRRALELVM